MADLIYKRVSTDRQSTDRQNIVLADAQIEDPVVFEESSGTSSRLHPLKRPAFEKLLSYARPGDTVHVSEMFRLVRGTGHILDVLDVLHDQGMFLKIHDGAFSAMDLTARHPRTGELLSTVKFMVQTLAAAGELQRDLQRELTFDGLRASQARGVKGGRRPVISDEKVIRVRASYQEGTSIAALAREYGVSRGAVRTAIGDLIPGEQFKPPAPEQEVPLDMPGRVADRLRPMDLDPILRSALDSGVAVRRGQGYSLRVTATHAVHQQLLELCQPTSNAYEAPAQKKARREYGNRVDALTTAGT